MSSWFEGAGSGSPLDVPKMLDSAAGEGLFALMAAGALVSVGLTSDGGALGVTVTVDGKWRREYFRDGDALALWIAEALPAVIEARGGAVAPSSAGAQRSRGRRTR